MRQSPDESSDGVPPSDQSDPEEVARLICLQQLERKPRTKAELAVTLQRRGVPPEAAVAVLERFEAVGLVDDVTFARQWVEERHHNRGSSRRALADELRRKGVEQEIIAEATGQIDAEDEESTARELVERKLRSLQRFDEATRTRRLVGMLARKGYSAGLAYRVVSQQLGRDGSTEID